MYIHLDKMTIIGICGKMGVGKDFIAQQVIMPFIEQTKKKCIQLSFADQLKVNVISKHKVSFNDVYVQKTDATRALLQREGTEHGRNVIGQDVWIQYFDTWAYIHASRGIHHIVCCDVRFRNEVDYIRKMRGTLIRVVAPKRNHERLMHESGGDMSVYKKLAEHVSECDLDGLRDEEFDIVINNDETDEKVSFDKILTEKLVV